MRRLFNLTKTLFTRLWRGTFFLKIASNQETVGSSSHCSNARKSIEYFDLYWLSEGSKWKKSYICVNWIRVGCSKGLCASVVVSYVAFVLLFICSSQIFFFFFFFFGASGGLCLVVCGISWAFSLICLILLLLNTTCPVLANSVLKKPTDLDLYCLSLNLWILYQKIRIK